MAHFLVALRAVVANQANMSITHLFVSIKLVASACFLEDLLTLCQKDPSVKSYDQISFFLGRNWLNFFQFFCSYCHSYIIWPLKGKVQVF